MVRFPKLIDFLLLSVQKRAFFLATKGSPHEWCSPQCIFHIRCQNFVAGLAHTLCELIHRIWTLPHVWDKEYGNVFLEPPGQLQKWKITQKKTIQLVCYGQVFAKHSYSCTWKWAVFCSTRSGNLEAVRLQGHIHRIFSRGSSSKEEKGRQTQNMKTRLSWTILVWFKRLVIWKLKMVRFPVP